MKILRVKLSTGGSIAAAYPETFCENWQAIKKKNWVYDIDYKGRGFYCCKSPKFRRLLLKDL